MMSVAVRSPTFACDCFATCPATGGVVAGSSRAWAPGPAGRRLRSSAAPACRSSCRESATHVANWPALRSRKASSGTGRLRVGLHWLPRSPKLPKQSGQPRPKATRIAQALSRDAHIALGNGGSSGWSEPQAAMRGRCQDRTSTAATQYPKSGACRTCVTNKYCTCTKPAWFFPGQRRRSRLLRGNSKQAGRGKSS